MAQKRTDQPAQRLSVVVPVYNEAPGILRFHEALSTVLGSLHKPCEIIYIDDGSIDDTAKILAGIAADDTRVSVLELSRNFGHQAALIAGLDRALGDVIITLDGDGEHPCELIVQMIELIDMGYEVVLTQRASDKMQLPLTKRFSSALFYAVINRLSETPRFSRSRWRQFSLWLGWAGCSWCWPSWRRSASSACGYWERAMCSRPVGAR